jgi:Leucine-rich repeat (LRR) protein
MSSVEGRVHEWLSKGVKALLDLSDLDLVDIPVLPDSVTRLKLDNNRIKYLKFDQLPTKLGQLDINNNGLEHIEWFPETLVNLSAKNNNLTELPPLPSKLMFIHIEHNNIQTLPNIPRRLNLLYCYGNPMPIELVEDESPYEFLIYHIPRIRLWRKYLKRRCELK